MATRLYTREKREVQDKSALLVIFKQITPLRAWRCFARDVLMSLDN